MDAALRTALEQKLRWEREHLDSGLLGSHRQPAAPNESIPSSVKDRADRTRASGLRTADAIKEIDAALLRLADGRYGICLRCLRPIAATRLHLLPATRFCLRCARRAKHGPPGL
jgi:RNA polymerase-binding transcription factor DksA